MQSNAIKRMGIFRALNQGVVQFNSVIFRIVAGVLGVLPLETVALVTTLEKLLNAFLEVPTGFLADKYGRVRTASWGLSLIILGLVSLYFAILMRHTPLLSNILVVFDGICLGLAIPLTSGSIEAFYQEALKRCPNGSKFSSTSQTVSARYGKWIPLSAVVLAILLLYFMSLFDLAHHLILVGAFFWLLVLIRLNLDARVLGDYSSNQLNTAVRKFESFSQLLRKMALVPELRRSILMTCLYRIFSIMTLGYLIISIGREYQSSSSEEYYFLMMSFIVGCFGPGWYLVGTYLPRWIESKTDKEYVLRLFLGSFVLNIICIVIYRSLNTWMLGIFLFLYGTFFMVKVIGLQSLSKNLLLTSVAEENYAKYLSVLSIFGLGASGVYSLYITLFRRGAPSILEICITSLVVITIGVLVLNIPQTSLKTRS